MLFNSLTFALFLPVVFLLYWFVFNRNLKWQNFFLLVASYVFYGWWDWRFLSLIFISSASDFILGKLIFASDNEKKRKLYLALSLVVNLGLLGFFKYFNFFVDSFVDAASRIGYQPDISTLQIILPVGISFYTFQTLSYTIDIFRKKTDPTHDVIAFFAFVSFFPQLVAGPIERASRLLPQFMKKRQFNLESAKDGLRQILWGLIKKVVVADTLAIQVQHIFDQPQYNHATGLILIYGAVLFTFQIYCDFSGYSDIAIGTARLFGFSLMRNFAFPFFSRNIGEFWQRWHISLSTWFRDYVYIPLGGSRVSKWKQVRNIFLTYVLSGLWHGANWTFIIWGALHAFYYLPLMLFKGKGKHTRIVAENRILPTIGDFAKMAFTFFMFSFSLIFFRSETLRRALSYLKNMAINFEVNVDAILNLFITTNSLMIFVLIIVEWIQRRRAHTLQIENIPAFPRWVIYAAALAIFIYYGQFGNQQQFIYFQF
jgi:D-alanyl-lipoteichoic acid acyltransferase DltB (MBOAT superfamily)